MAKFKHINGGITEVFTQLNINRLRKDKNYSEVLENASKKVKETPKKIKEAEKVEEVVEDKPLQQEVVYLNQYVTELYYSGNFVGVIIPTDDIEKYLKLAQEKIDEVTHNRIVAIGFDNLTDFQKECISKAICYQADYYFANGINSLSNVSSYSVLDISINVDNTIQTEAQKKDMDELAYMNVKKSGLASGLL